MPYKFQPEEAGILVNFYGNFTNNDNIYATIGLYSLPNFQNLKYIIWDFSDVVEMNFTETETDVASIGDKAVSARLPYTKVALVTQDPFIKTLCDAYIDQCRSRQLMWDFLISKSVHEARIWIDS